MSVAQRVKQIMATVAPQIIVPAAALQQDPEILRLETRLRRAHEETAELGSKLPAMPKIGTPPEGGSARTHFEKFDVDVSGCIGYQETMLGLRAAGLDVDPEKVIDIFERCDTDGDGRISMQEFPLLAEQAAALQTGNAASAVGPRDVERLASAARVLHEQALSEPLTLVAEGEVPTLLRCAASGHTAIEQLGLSALAAVAGSAHAHCAQAIAARPALADVFGALARPSLPLPSVRQGARLLAAMCQEAIEAKELGVRRKIRLRLYDSASPLLHGTFGRRAAADESQAARDIAVALAAFASEPELAARLGSDGGGGALRLACELARSSSAGARAAAVDTIYEAAAAGGDNVWKLVGFGAVEPLVVAASTPPGLAMHHEYDGRRVDETAARALGLLRFDELWRGVRGADPLAGHVDER